MTMTGGWVPTGGGGSPLTTKGDLWGYDTTDDRIPVGSDGQVLTADSAQGLGVKWADSGGGSSSAPEWLTYLNGRLASETPNDDDDFFQSSGFSDWTQVDGGSVTGTWTEGFDLASLSTSGGSAGDISAQVKELDSLSTGDYIETATAGFGLGGDFPHFGLVLADGATGGSGQQVFGGYSIQPRQIQCYDWSGYDTRDGTTQFVVLRDPPMLEVVYLRLLYVSANTFRTSYSSDGVTWLALSDASITCTPTHGGIAASPYGSDTIQGRFHYFRRGSI